MSWAPGLEIEAVTIVRKRKYFVAIRELVHEGTMQFLNARVRRAVVLPNCLSEFVLFPDGPSSASLGR